MNSNKQTPIYAQGTCVGSNNYKWAELQQDYKSARANLSLLAKESGSLGSMAEKLILEIDSQYLSIERRVQNFIPLSRSLTAPMPRPISRKLVKGILAYRAWNIEVKGTLSPAIVQMDKSWEHEVAFADSIPDTDSYSKHGLYATRLENWESNNYTPFVSGIVDLYGRVIEHSDGILRAECARILCIILTINSDTDLFSIITRLYENLKLSYPLIPIYIMTPYTKKLFMYREILINYNMLQGVYPYGL